MDFFMRDPETGQHHKGPDKENIIIHFPNTCHVHYIEENVSSKPPFDIRSKAIETRLAPSRKGWVAICYEKKGLITFYAQISESRAAWQRISWVEDFHKNWDNNKIQKAIKNFIWVAECEEAGELLPKVA